MTNQEVIAMLKNYPPNAELKIMYQNSHGYGISPIGLGDSVIGHNENDNTCCLLCLAPDDFESSASTDEGHQFVTWEDTRGDQPLQ